jgi:hypothetical protein
MKTKKIERVQICQNAPTPLIEQEVYGLFRRYMTHFKNVPKRFFHDVIAFLKLSFGAKK